LDHTTALVIGVLWLPDHAYGTFCQYIYDRATVSDSSKVADEPSIGCMGPWRLVTFLLKSAV